MIAFWIVAALSLCVHTADVVTTNINLAKGDVEDNPIMAWLQKQLGVWWVVPRMTLAAGIVVGAYFLPYPLSIVALALTSLYDLIFGVLNNLGINE